MKRALMLMAACVLAAGSFAADGPQPPQPQVEVRPKLATVAQTLDEAKKIAAKDGKDVIVVLFKGDAKNPKTVEQNKLEKVIFGDDFSSSVADTAVLVVSNDEGILKSINLTESTGFVVLDSVGRITAAVDGYFDVTPKEYAAAVQQFQQSRRQRDLLLKKADAEKGVERAKLLHLAMLSMAQCGLFQNGSYYGYDNVIKEIKELDKADSAQLKSQWAFYDLTFAVIALLDQKKNDDGVKLVNEYVAAYKATNVRFAQRAVFMKAEIAFQSGNGDGITAAMKEAADLDPTTPEGQKAAEFLKMLEARQKQEQQRQQQQQQQQQQDQPKAQPQGK